MLYQIGALEPVYLAYIIPNVQRVSDEVESSIDWELSQMKQALLNEAFWDTFFSAYKHSQPR